MVIAGGGNDRYNLLPGSGAQVLLLGTGADTVFAYSGAATVDGNAGGKLILLGDGANLVSTHPDAAGPAASKDCSDISGASSRSSVMPCASPRSS